MDTGSEKQKNYVRRPQLSHHDRRNTSETTARAHASNLFLKTTLARSKRSSRKRVRPKLVPTKMSSCQPRLRRSSRSPRQCSRQNANRIWRRSRSVKKTRRSRSRHCAAKRFRAATPPEHAAALVAMLEHRDGGVREAFCGERPGNGPGDYMCGAR